MYEYQAFSIGLGRPWDNWSPYDRISVFLQKRACNDSVSIICFRVFNIHFAARAQLINQLINVMLIFRLRSFNNFKSDGSLTQEIPSTTCAIHPDANEAVQALTFAQLEEIFCETRAHNSCYKAVAMYQYFLKCARQGRSSVFKSQMK
jgi:hypothetical protein